MADTQPTTKELRLRLSVESDPARGSMALRDMAQYAERTAAGLGKAHQEAVKLNERVRTPGGAGGGPSAIGGAPPPMTPPGSAIGGWDPRQPPPPSPGGAKKASDGFGLDDVRGLAMRSAAVVASVAAVVDTAASLTAAYQQLDNSMLSSRQKLLGFVQAVPLVGDSLARLIGNTLNAMERLRNPELAKQLDIQQARQPFEMASIAQVYGAQGQFERLRNEANDAAIRARVLGGGANFAVAEMGAAAVGGFGAIGGAAVRDPRLTDALAAQQQARRDENVAFQQWLASAQRAQNQQMQVLDANAAADAAMRAANEARKGAGIGAAVGQPQAGIGRGAGLALGVDQALDNLGVPGWLKQGMFGPAGKIALIGLGKLAPEAADKAGAALRGNPGRNELLDALLNEQKAIATALREQDLLQLNMNDKREKALALDQRRAELMKAEQQVMKTRLQLMDEEANKVRGSLGQLSQLNEAQQDSLLMALRRFKEEGKGAVSGDQLQFLLGNQITAQFVQDRLRREVEDSAIAKRLLEETGQRDLKILDQMREKLRTEVNVKVDLDEKRIAQNVADTMKGIAPEFEKAIARVVQLELRRIINEMGLGNLQR